MFDSSMLQLLAHVYFVASDVVEVDIQNSLHSALTISSERSVSTKLTHIHYTDCRERLPLVGIARCDSKTEPRNTPAAEIEAVNLGLFASLRAVGAQFQALFTLLRD
jgi:hypothetical protein